MVIQSSGRITVIKQSGGPITVVKQSGSSITVVKQSGGSIMWGYSQLVLHIVGWSYGQVVRWYYNHGER